MKQKSRNQLRLERIKAAAEQAYEQAMARIRGEETK